MTPAAQPRYPVVFLFDVDNTLLDNDRVEVDLQSHLTHVGGAELQTRYWTIFEKLRAELGYADYLGALQRYRVEHPHDPHLIEISSFLVNYPFAERLLPGALDAIAHCAAFGTPIILSDGDVVFQPLKIERARLFTAVDGRVLVYIHKEHELEDVERRYPADHYVLIDDKVRILDAVKQVWGGRLTTVFPRQGHYANAADVTSYPPPDISIARISDLLDYDVPALRSAAQRSQRR